MKERLDITPTELADQVFEQGNEPEDVARALEELREGRDEFLARLAIRVAIEKAEETAVPEEEEVSSAMLDRLEGLYRSEAEKHDAARARIDLTKAEPWIGAEAALGGDRSFVIKLATRRIRPPDYSRIMRDIADAIGVALNLVRHHFGADEPVITGAAAEYKASGKPAAGQTEDFADAVRVAKVPDELKRRWLES